MDTNNRDPQILRDVFFSLRGDQSFFALDIAQQRQQSDALVFVFVGDLIQLFYVFRSKNKDSYLSNSPAIILTDPKVGTKSAIMPPIKHFGNAAMIEKHGG